MALLQIILYSFESIAEKDNMALAYSTGFLKSSAIPILSLLID